MSAAPKRKPVPKKSATTKFNLGGDSVRELNRALHDPDSEGKAIRVVNPDGKHNVAVGARYAGDIVIDGPVGYYCARDESERRNRSQRQRRSRFG